MNENYFQERNKKNAVLLKQLKGELPFICEEFFLGIDSRTSMLTKVSYARDLKIFFYFLTTEIYDFQNIKMRAFSFDDLNRITSSHLEMYLDYLNYYEVDNKTYTNTNKTKARKLSSLRTFFKYFYKKDRIKQNVASKIDIPKINEKEIIRLTENEVTDLINLAEDGKRFERNQKAFFEHTKLRDLAILSLFLGTGIRISELVGLNINDFNFDRMILYFSKEVGENISNYINERKTQEQDLFEPSSALFLSIQRKRINVRTVEKLVKKYASCVTPLKKITPHKLRSTFGTNLYNDTKDIYVVAEVLGHKDINTTKKHYAAQSENVRRKALSNVKLKKTERIKNNDSQKCKYYLDNKRRHFTSINCRRNRPSRRLFATR